MFENTSNDMQDVIDKMYEDGFHPDNLSPRERRAYDAMYDQCQTMMDRFEELEEMLQEEEEARWVAEEAEELRQEEYEMHKAIVGIQQADEDFGHTFKRHDDDDSYKHTFSRSDDCSSSSYDYGSSSSDSSSSCSGD
ncbi:hypothetical protein GAP32_344 [Cronobacter phage vB_CsaM_GAP32]|uniref:Uncharacterized protein n=1 Tax=Cronobacter phage vB_CsaM_GAP32 TaxID=1141136 RepID=K4FB63_9CAUD|nr:hypothetical protein GAP32_344 [Cronobacter phage vB_CsaM_GAP32]AFC21794.1 hypothetical protein GAP32_344 [Cronobacter phage vB_CsaM_GAP32]